MAYVDFSNVEEERLSNKYKRQKVIIVVKKTNQNETSCCCSNRNGKAREIEGTKKRRD